MDASHPLILIVDDDLVIRSLLRRVLQKDGYQIEQAADGVEAVTAFIQFQPDLVLLDAMMPELDGFAACAQIKALPQGDQTPILMITSLQDNDSVDRAFKVGATDFIPKPINWAVLRHRVQRIIRARYAEEALRESERRLDLAVKGGDLGLWDWGIKNRTMVVNDRWLEMLGYSPAEITVTVSNWFDFVHPDDVEPVRMAIIRFLRSREVQYQAEFRMRAKEGGWRWILARGRVVERDENNKPVRAAGTHLDITERKQAEHALRDSEERFRQVVASISDHLYFTEMQADGGCINRYVSPNIENIIGYSPEKIHADWNFWLTHLIHPDDRELAKAQLAMLAAGVASEMEYRMLHRDGSVVWVRDSAQVKCNGQLRLIYGVVSNVTERKRSEEMLRASQKLAELGTLAAGVAHEINSPLQVITGLSEILRKRVEEDRLEPDYFCRKLDVIHRNSWRCAEIVRSLKTYAYAASTQMAPNDLNEIIQDTLLLIEHQLVSWANIELVVELQPELPPLNCDRNQIAQVIINLLTNARDAMPDGGQIHMLTRYDSSQEQFVLQVADTGHGMSETVRAKIFDPFFTTKSVDRGTGLGLSIISGIIKAHGGEIRVQSAPHQGTTFIITFPSVVTMPQPAPEGVGRFDETGSPVNSVKIYLP